MTVVVVGPMGAGKSSIGRRLAKALGEPFVDTDAMIVAEHGPIPELFRDRGEGGFRRIERETVHRALAGGGVVSLGGGAILDPATRAELAEHLVVALTVSEDAVADRLRGSDRPLLTDGLESWRRIASERRPLYEAVATWTVDTSRRPITTIAEELADRVRAGRQEVRP